MQRRTVILANLALFASAARAAAISEGDAGSGMRAALERGALAAVDLLAKPDGFVGNPAVRIDLPGHLKDVARLLRTAGQGKLLDDLLLAMNRAAELAVAAAKPLLLSAIKSISFSDAMRILRGGEDAATQYFAAKTRAPLALQFLPIVTEATQKVSLAQKYKTLAAKASSLGLHKPEDASIEQYVTTRALDELYLMIGLEERKIRQDPIGTGSAILKKVFGA